MHVYNYVYFHTAFDVGEITNSNDKLFYQGGATGNLRKRQTDQEFVPIFYDDLTFTDEQREVCENSDTCLFDLAVTNDMTFANNTLNQEKVANSTIAILSKNTYYESYIITH